MTWPGGPEATKRRRLVTSLAEFEQRLLARVRASDRAGDRGAPAGGGDAATSSPFATGCPPRRFGSRSKPGPTGCSTNTPGSPESPTSDGGPADTTGDGIGDRTGSLVPIGAADRPRGRARRRARRGHAGPPRRARRARVRRDSRGAGAGADRSGASRRHPRDHWSRSSPRTPDRRPAGDDPACGGQVYRHIAYPAAVPVESPRPSATPWVGSARSPTPESIVVLPSPEQGYRLRARLHVGTSGGSGSDARDHTTSVSVVGTGQADQATTERVRRAAGQPWSRPDRPTARRARGHRREHRGHRAGRPLSAPGGGAPARVVERWIAETDATEVTGVTDETPARATTAARSGGHGGGVGPPGGSDRPTRPIRGRSCVGRRHSFRPTGICCPTLVGHRVSDSSDPDRSSTSMRGAGCSRYPPRHSEDDPVTAVERDPDALTRPRDSTCRSCPRPIGDGDRHGGGLSGRLGRLSFEGAGYRRPAARGSLEDRRRASGYAGRAPQPRLCLVRRRDVRPGRGSPVVGGVRVAGG